MRVYISLNGNIELTIYGRLAIFRFFKWQFCKVGNAWKRIK